MIPLFVSSQYISKTTGNWDIGTNWYGDASPPLTSGTKLSNDIIISQWDDITHNGDLEVQSGANLVVEGMLVVTGNLIFKNGADVLISSTGILHILSNGGNANNSTNVTVNGQMIIDNDFSAGNGSTIKGTGSLRIIGNSSGDGSIFGTGTGCSDCNFRGTALPIVLMSFDAVVQVNSVYLKWVVTSQINTNYFTIYKSYNNCDWVDVIELDGEGTTNIMMEYEWCDENTQYGVVYYKLRQTDFDGKYEEYPPIPVTIINSNKPIEIISTFNLSGVEVNCEYRGFIINIYNDGSVEKIFRNL